MSDHRPQRVRVTGPPRHVVRRPVPRPREIDEETRLGEIFMGSLLREQLRLALAVLGLLALGVGSLPLVFYLAPELADVGFAGMPVPWVLLAFAVYPFVWLLGWRYVRAAEQNERDFTALMDIPDERP